MNDYDAWIKEVLDEATSPGGDLNAMVRRIYDEAYAHAQETIRDTTPKGLPIATPWQALAFLNKLEPEVRSDSCALASAFSEWFNDPSRSRSSKHPDWAYASHETVLGNIYVSDDAVEQFIDNVTPNRDAPVKPTMHPDLEWLARQPVTDFRLNCDRSKVLGFYRKGEDVAAALRPEDGRLWASNNPPVFSLEAVHQARRHLAKQEALGIDMTNATVKAQEETVEFNYKPTAEYECGHESTITDHAIPFMCPECGDGTFTTATGLQPETEYRVTFTGVAGDGPWRQEFDATAARERAARNYAQGSILNLLANLPDYEAWFADHGHETTTGNIIMPTTVHELYTHFRARLLDELRQAGVIGDD